MVSYLKCGPQARGALVRIYASDASHIFDPGSCGFLAYCLWHDYGPYPVAYDVKPIAMGMACGLCPISGDAYPITYSLWRCLVAYSMLLLACSISSRRPWPVHLVACGLLPVANILCPGLWTMPPYDSTMVSGRWPMADGIWHLAQGHGLWTIAF